MHPNELLFLDNYRGFNATIIPLRDITFFVGENSTGKSSVISTLNLLRGFNFWSDPEFDTEDQHLGGFDDLISANSPVESFTIGSARMHQTYTGKKLPFTVFATFTSKEGLPHITKLSFINKGGLITVLQAPDGVYYKQSNLQGAAVESIFDTAMFSNAASLHKGADRRSCSKMELKDADLESLPLYHLLGIAERLLRRRNQETPAQPPDTDEIADIYSFMGSGEPAVWLAPIRTKPRRTYDGTKKAFSAEGDHTPYLLKKQLGKQKAASAFKKMIANLGRESHLFKSLRIKTFGQSESAPFEVQVNLDGVHLSISNVGYGVSQVLPILAEIVSRDKACVFHIQQPEVHLHPRAQAALGDLFFSLADQHRKKFVIETHSDFLIDRFRSAMASKQEDLHLVASVVFFSRTKGQNQISELILARDGSYPESQPKDFREFFIHEQLRNLAI